MLYALAHPLALAVLLVSFVVGLTAHGWLQARVAALLGEHRFRRSERLKPDPRLHLDPFGAVAALISGLGWVTAVEVVALRGTARKLVVFLVGPALNVILGVGLLIGARIAYGRGAVGVGGASTLLQHGAVLGSVGDVLVLAGASQLYLGVLSLMPIPPLDGGRLLFAVAPRSHGWRRAEHQLVERNIGVAVVLALLVIPLGGPVPLLPQLLDTLLSPVLRAILGA